MTLMDIISLVAMIAILSYALISSKNRFKLYFDINYEAVKDTIENAEYLTPTVLFLKEEMNPTSLKTVKGRSSKFTFGGDFAMLSVMKYRAVRIDKNFDFSFEDNGNESSVIIKRNGLIYTLWFSKKDCERMKSWIKSIKGDSQ